MGDLKRGSCDADDDRTISDLRKSEPFARRREACSVTSPSVDLWSPPAKLAPIVMTHYAPSL